MSAYWIGRARVRDLAGYQIYGKLVATAAERHPNQVLVRGGQYRVLEGPDHFDRFVVIRFSSVEAAVAYYNSPEYREAATIRHEAASRCELAIIEGID
jgi:uncharacterized protein (DUF1330 family)